MKLAQQLGKEPALLKKDIPGFICNRLGYAMYREAIHLLEQGVADAATIDRSVRNSFGLWASFCGPFRWIDISGGAAFYARSMAGVLPSLADSHQLTATLTKMIELNAKGVKDSVGFYEYAAGDAAKWAEGFEASVVNTWRFQERHVPRDAEEIPSTNSQGDAR
jgi:3-hydroxybutyryl-CoA dehydrogenase